MTLPGFLTFEILTPRNPKMPKKTDQADQIVQTDHLTGHASDQTFSHLA